MKKIMDYIFKPKIQNICAFIMSFMLVQFETDLLFNHSSNNYLCISLFFGNYFSMLFGFWLADLYLEKRRCRNDAN